MLRVKNEQQWIGPCIESIVDWFDEIVVCLQNCTDKTETILESFNNKKIRIYHYHHDSWPNGEGYNKQDASHHRSRTYFYNWCLKRTSMTHVCKWDGDMVAMDWLGDTVHAHIRDGSDIIRIHGVDIVGKDLRHVGAHKYCASEPRFFRVRPTTRYVNGRLCEKITGIHGDETIIHAPAFLHFKWAKPLDVATQAWPANWQDSPHFQNLIKRVNPVETYNGEYPKCLIQTTTH